MNTKIMIAATVAALSLATTAFAQGEGRGQPFPAYAESTTSAPNSTARDTGSSAYPAYSLALSSTRLSQATLPENGSNGIVQSPNAMPPGAMVGTAPYMQAQVLNRWFAEQDAKRFAQARRLRPNG